MTTGFGPERLDVSNENPTEIPNSTSEMKPDSVETEPQKVSTVRRKRRRRNFAPTTNEYSTPSAMPVYVSPVTEHVPGRRRRRSRRNTNRRKRRKMWRIVMYVTVHVVFIVLLIFLWIKITAKVAE